MPDHTSLPKHRPTPEEDACDRYKINAEFKAMEMQYEMAGRRSEVLRQKLERIDSREFIRVNGVTREDVERANILVDDGKPIFNVVMEFAKWLRENGCTKRFCSWNGVIHFTAELAAERFLPTSGRVEDLPEDQARGGF